MKGILFDFYGVLVEYPGGSARVLKEVLDSRESVEFVKRVYKPLSRKEALGEITEMQFLLLLAKQVSSKKVLSGREGEELAERQVFKFPETKEVLEALGKRFRVGIASNGLLQREMYFLKKHGLVKLFDAVTVSSEIGLLKPNPRFYLIACERLGVSPRECYYVGDTEDDLRGALEAGLCPVFVKGEDVECGLSKVIKVRGLRDLLELR